MTYTVRGIRAKSGGSCPGDTCPTSDAPTTCCRSPGPTDCCVVVGRPVNLPKSRLASRAAPPRTDGESAPPRYFLPREHLLSAGAAGRPAAHASAQFISSKTISFTAAARRSPDNHHSTKVHVNCMRALTSLIIYIRSISAVKHQQPFPSVMTKEQTQRGSAVADGPRDFTSLEDFTK